MFKLTYVESAIERILKYLKIDPGIEEVSLADSISRISAEDIVSDVNIPPFNRSAVDGYAVKSEDTFGASTSSPIYLKVKGRIEVGSSPKISIGPGECVEVSTGSMIPEGADAVIMREHTKLLEDGLLEVYESVSHLENISLIGEDLKRGEKVVCRGDVIRPWHVGVLASINVCRIRVLKPWTIGVFSTGSELVEACRRPGPGKIIASTKEVLKAYFAEKGFNVIDYGIVEDDLNKIAEMFRRALSECEVVVSTGGTSVGRRDYTVKAIELQDGLEDMVHGIAVKPGRPAAIASVGGRLVIAASGLPVAALVDVEALFHPIYEHYYGLNNVYKPVVEAVLDRRIYVGAGLRGYVRVMVYRSGGVVRAMPLRITGSGVLSTLLRANGVLIVEEDVEGFDEGETVRVELLAPILEEGEVFEWKEDI